MKNFLKSLKEKLKSSDSSLITNYKIKLSELLKKSVTTNDKKSTNIKNKSFISFDMSEVAQKILEPSFRGIIHKSFVIIFAISASYSIGKITAVTLKGKTVTKRIAESTPITPPIIKQSDFDKIKNADLFNANNKDQKLSQQTKKETRAVIDQKKVCITAQQTSPLQITLLNTVVMQDSVKSIASVQLRSQKDTQKIREGEILEGMAQIGRIERLKLIFKNLQNGKCEYVINDDIKSEKTSPINILSPSESKLVSDQQKNPEIKNEGNKFTIKKTFLNEKLQNIGTILTQARAIQINNPDGSLSFNLQEVEPGSIYTTLGLGNNDTITEINGKKIHNINQIMDLFGKIRNIDNLSLKVNRNGSDSTMEYNLSE